MTVMKMTAQRRVCKAAAALSYYNVHKVCIIQPELAAPMTPATSSINISVPPRPPARASAHDLGHKVAGVLDQH